MKSLHKIKPYWSHFFILLFIIVFSQVYFYPTLEGKKILQPDISQYKGMVKGLSDFKNETGEKSLWVDNMFSGMPSFLISASYPGNILAHFNKLFRKLFHPASMLMLFIIGFYILLISLGIDKWQSIVGAIAYGLSSHLIIIIAAGHNTKAYAIGYMAPIIAGVLLSLRGKIKSGTLLFTAALSLQILANHLQITYYTLILIVVLGCVEVVYAYRNKTIPQFAKAIGLLIIGCIIAIGMNFSRLYTTWEYSKETIRGKSELVLKNGENQTSGLNRDYIVQWSQGIDETLTLLIPNYKGGASDNMPSVNSESFKTVQKHYKKGNAAIPRLSTYHGDKPHTSGPIYFGAIVIFLFILSLFVVKGPIKWWLVLITVISIVMSWGKNVMGLTNFLLDYLPLYNKFRAPEMILVLTGFAVPLLGFIGLNAVLSKQISKEKLKRALIYSFAITGGVTILFSFLPSLAGDFSSPRDAATVPDWLIESLIADRMKMLSTDALRSFLFILSGFGVLYLWYLEKLKSTLMIFLLGALILIDLWQVDKRYLNNDDFVIESIVQEPYQETIADKEILKDETLNYRVLSVVGQTFKSTRNAYFHKAIGGYHAAKLARYDELIRIRIMPEITLLKRGLELGIPNKVIFERLPVLNMLNTKYVINDLNKPPITNPKAVGNAWFVGRPFLVDDANEEIKLLPKLKYNYLALVDKRFEDLLTNKVFNHIYSGKITLTEDQPNYLKYSFSSPYEQLTIFSEIYYDKGWESYIDGKKVPHFRANYILRAMIIPKGNHIIEFKFNPKSISTGSIIGYICSAIFVLSVAFCFFYFYRNKREESIAKSK